MVESGTEDVTNRNRDDSTRCVRLSTVCYEVRLNIFLSLLTKICPTQSRQVKFYLVQVHVRKD